MCFRYGSDNSQSSLRYFQVKNITNLGLDSAGPMVTTQALNFNEPSSLDPASYQNHFLIYCIT